jgi:DNA-binding PadR family transcriptional regulator
MIPQTAAGSNGQPDSSATATLPSLFGILPGASPRKAASRRQKNADIAPDLDEPAPKQSGSSTSTNTEARAPESGNRPGSNARTAGLGKSKPSGVRRAQRAPRRRFRPVQVRDRRFIHTFLLAAAKTAPTGQMMIDFVRERSDGVFVLSAGVVYRELHALEKERLIAVRRDDRERRYTLTDLGKRVLVTRQREWQAFSHGLARLLDEAADGDRRRRE